jgi:hypothetical protein
MAANSTQFDYHSTAPEWSWARDVLFWWMGEHGTPRIDTSEHLWFVNAQLAVRLIDPEPGLLSCAKRPWY